jgi:hypothetical protein
MQNLLISFCGIIFLCASLCVTAVAADGARLFDSTSFVATDKESSLSPEEAKHLTFLRGHPTLIIRPTLLSLNREALDSGIITVVTPEGKEFQYVGQKKLNEQDGTYLWRGKSATGFIVISYGKDSLYGQFQEDGKMYSLQALSKGKFHVLGEMPQVPNGIQETFTKPASAAAK